MCCNNVQGRDVLKYRTGSWCDAIPYRVVMCCITVQGRDVLHYRTGSWCAAIPYMVVMCCITVQGHDVLHYRTGSWCAANLFLQFKFLTAVSSKVYGRLGQSFLHFTSQVSTFQKNLPLPCSVQRGFSFIMSRHRFLRNFLVFLHSRFRASWLYINKIQQDATVCRYYLLQIYSTCFGCPPHPSSGVHKTVTAASGTGTFLQRSQSHDGGSLLLRYYGLYQRLQLHFYVFLMMGAMDTPNM